MLIFIGTIAVTSTFIGTLTLPIRLPWPPRRLLWTGI